MDCLPHIHVAAFHQEAGYHSATPGIGVLCRDGVWLVGAGVLRNSLAQTSKYGLVGWQPLRLGPVRIGAVAGVIDGYSYRQGAAFPFAAGALSVPVAWGEAHLTLVPKLQGVSPATVGLSFTLRY